MNTCGNEVLPFSPEVINGLKAFRIGLCIAFGLSSLSHVIINNIRRENNYKGNLDVVSKSGGLSYLNLVAVHLVPIGSILLQELNSTHWDSFSEERVHGWEETVTLVVFALIILLRSASVGFMTVTSVVFFISLHSLLRSADDERVAVVVFGSTLFSFLLLCVVLLRRSSVEPAALWAEQQSGVGVLRGVFLLFVAAQLALYALQRQEIVEAPIATLCAALLAGCVRHVFVVVCTDSHFDHVDANYNMEQSAIEEMEEADQEAEVNTMNDEDVVENHADCTGRKNVAPKMALRVDTTDTGDKDEEHQHHSSLAWSPSPTQVNLLSDHGKGDRNRQDASSEEQELPGIDAFGSAEFHRSNSTGISEQQRQYVHSDNASRRQLLRYVFHEMRAPLNSISMAVDLLTHHSKKGTPKNKFQDLEALQIIEEATLTMERTLKDTMTLQKIDEGSLVAQWKIFSVHSLCDDIKDALKQVLRSKSVTLNYAVDADVPEQIVGDHFRIRHVVAHVLSNAIKFSRAGGAVEMHVGLRDLSISAPPSAWGHPPASVAEGLRVCSSNLAGAELGTDSCSTDSATEGQGVNPQTATEYDLCPSARDSFEGLDDPSPAEFLKSPTGHLADGKYVVISITDNGIGMSSELQESDIFKPFNQLKTEEITGFRGSGLGLAICKKIITFLQGSITYSSVEGAGTTFRISFPLTRLDTASMDEVEEEDLPVIELACGSSDPMDHLLSPKTQQRNRAIAKAKSFRGEKLLSILHNQSNVFDCPTPGSCTASFHFHSRFSSTDESEGRHTRNSSGGSGPASGNLSVNVSASVSGSASNDHTPRSASVFAKSIPVSRVPSIAEDLEAGESSGVFRSGGSTPTPPRRAFAASGSLSPSRPLSSAASTLRKLQTVLESRNNSSELFEEDESNGSKSSPARDTHRDVSTFFHTSPVSYDDNNNNNTHTAKLTEEAGPRIMPGSMPTLPTIQTAMHSSLSLSHSHDHVNNSEANPSSPLSPIAAVSNSQAYVALTEKNVNLHILRTAATDGGFRAVKQTASKARKSCSKEDLLATLKACKVLVVDDAASNRKLLSMMLKRAGFGTVDLVEDGQAAVDYCTMARNEGDLPKIIFMDNTMPRMTGIEASRIIRQQGGYPHLIIGVTGNSMEEELDDFIAAGADLVIVKPLKNQSLEMLLGFIQTNGFDSSHGHRIDTVGQEFTWVPRK